MKRARRVTNTVPSAERICNCIVFAGNVSHIKCQPDVAKRILSFSKNRARGSAVLKTLLDTDSAPELSDKAGTRTDIRKPDWRRTTPVLLKYSVISSLNATFFIKRLWWKIEFVALSPVSYVITKFQQPSHFTCITFINHEGISFNRIHPDIIFHQCLVYHIQTVVVILLEQFFYEPKAVLQCLCVTKV